MSKFKQVTMWWWELGEGGESQMHTEHLLVFEDACCG